MCMYVPGLQGQVFKIVKNFSERSKESKEQKKNKGSVLVAESGYNTQFGTVWPHKGLRFFPGSFVPPSDKSGLLWRLRTLSP